MSDSQTIEKETPKKNFNQEEEKKIDLNSEQPIDSSLKFPILLNTFKIV